MKKLQFLTMAAAATLFVACADETVLTPEQARDANPESNAISFGTYLGKTAVTRTTLGKTGQMTNTLLQDENAGFGVFAYHSESQTITPWGKWDLTSSPMKEIEQAPNFMYNEKVTWNGTDPSGGAWIYSPVKYWPNGTDAANPSADPSNTATEQAPQYLSFFAYAPYVPASAEAYNHENSFVGVASGETSDLPVSGASIVFTGSAAPTATTSGIVAIAKNDNAHDTWVKYILDQADENNAVDLLWGLRGSTTYQETDNVNNTVASLGSAYNTDLTKQNVPEKVAFLFKHALSRIGGNTSKEESASESQICGLQVIVDVDAKTGDDQKTYFGTGSSFDNTVTLVTLKSVKIRDKYSYAQEPSSILYSQKDDITSDFLTDGWFDIMNGTWEKTASVNSHTTDNKGATYSVEATAANGELNPAIAEPATKPTSSNVDASGNWVGLTPTVGVKATQATNVYKEDVAIPGLLLIPGTDAGNTLYVTVDYVVRTADPKLQKGFSEVEQVITNEVSLSALTLEPNKFYTLVMRLGLTSVKFEAKVADWSGSANETYDEDGKPTGSGDKKEEKVYLPSNVVSTTNSGTASGAAGSTITVNLSATATTGTVQVSGMTASGYTSDKESVIASNSSNTDTDVTLNISGLTANYSNVPKLTTVTITQGTSPAVVTTINIVQAADNTFAVASTAISADGTTTKGKITVTANGETTVASTEGTNLGGSALTLTDLAAITATKNELVTTKVHNVSLNINSNAFTYTATIEQKGCTISMTDFDSDQSTVSNSNGDITFELNGTGSKYTVTVKNDSNVDVEAGESTWNIDSTDKKKIKFSSSITSGTYTVTVTYTDENGHTTTATKTYTKS